MKDVIVIGAGISGLTAAYECKKANLDFQVLEISPRPGGLIETLCLDGFQIETGPYTFTSSSNEILNLANELNLDKELIEANKDSKKRYVHMKGNLIEVPTSLKGFLESEILNRESKWMILEELFIPSVKKEESVEEFISRRFGTEVLKNLFQPYLNGVYAGDVKKLSANHVFRKLKELELNNGSIVRGAILSQMNNLFKPKKSFTLYSFKNGMQTLTDTLYNKLENSITLNAKNIHITRAKDFFIVNFKTNNKTINYTTNSILFSIPAHKINDFNYLLPDDIVSSFAEIEYAPIATVSQKIHSSKLKFPLDGFGFLCSREVNRKLLGTIYVSSIFPERSIPNYALLTSFIGGSLFKKISEMEKTEIETLASRELCEILKIDNTNSLETLEIKVHEKAIPQYNLGHSNIIEKINKVMDTNYGVFFTGNYFSGISINDTIKNAKVTSGEIIQYTKSSLR